MSGPAEDKSDRSCRTEESASEPAVSPFDDADLLLLNEARERFNFEQRSAVALHSKSTFFFGVTAAFAALIAGFLGRPLENSTPSPLDLSIRATYLISFTCLSICAIRLAQSVPSRSYEVIATPNH